MKKAEPPVYFFINTRKFQKTQIECTPLPSCAFLRLILISPSHGKAACIDGPKPYKRLLMSRMNLRVFSWICWLFLLTASGQARSDETAATDQVVPPPASQVLDPSGVLDTAAGTFDRISRKLLKLNSNHGFQVHLIVERVIIAETPTELAQRLKKAWLPGADGMVIVFEADTRTVGAGRLLERDKQGPEQVPSFVSSDLLNRAMLSIDPQLAHPEFLDVFTDNLVREFETYFQLRATPTPPERNFKVELVIIGTLALMGLIAIGARALIAHTSMADVQTYEFPDVDAVERLGAPSGAAVTARRFAATTPGEMNS